MNETRIARARRAVATWAAIVAALMLVVLIAYLLIEPQPFRL